MIINREKVVADLTQHLLDAMDMNELMDYAYEQMSGYFNKLSENELIEECDNAEFDIEVSA